MAKKSVSQEETDARARAFVAGTSDYMLAMSLRGRELSWVVETWARENDADLLASAIYVLDMAEARAAQEQMAYSAAIEMAVPSDARPVNIMNVVG